MKWCCLLSAACITLSSYCQLSVQAETQQGDTASVNALIRLSKEFQWKDSNRSLEYADQALALARSLAYRDGIAHAYNLKGFCFWTFGDNDQAIAAAMEALTIGEETNNSLIQSGSYYVLARAYMDLGELAKASQCIGKAEQLALMGTDWEQLTSIYNLKGVIKYIDGRKDSALYYYTNAYETGRVHGVAPIHFPRIISNIGECQADPASAFRHFNEALALAKETQNPIAEASINDIIGHAFLKDNDLNSAETHLQSALALAQKLGLRRVVRHAYAGLVDIRVRQGRGDEAMVYLQRYYAVRDSLLNSSKIRQIVELEAAHELQLQEKQVQLLEKENQIQALWMNLLMLLIIFLILVSAGIYLLQRYRYRRNREILNLEIDYLTRQHKDVVDKYKASILPETNDSLESQDQRLLKNAIAIVEHHINDPQFGVEKMAEEMNMSRTNLHRKIKSITGFPPSELIRSIRLRKAARLIQSKVDSVTQIAHLVGFDDYSHFSKAFKKHFGVSPSGYEDQSGDRYTTDSIQRGPLSEA